MLKDIFLLLRTHLWIKTFCLTTRDLRKWKSYSWISNHYVANQNETLTYLLKTIDSLNMISDICEQ